MTREEQHESPVALVTGASRGLGHALTSALVLRGWRVVVDARNAARLADALTALRSPALVTAIPGDVTDPRHRQNLADVVAETGGLDLLVNNASVLGPSPQPRLADCPLEALRQVYEVNTFAPLALTQLLLPHLEQRAGCLVNISSDAAVEPYEGWGGYGSSKAALDQLTAILRAEQPALRVYSFDPGDMNTDLHQQAFPAEDISDRPSADSVVPALLRLVDEGLPGGRYRASELSTEVTA